jgi:hypothetical protein
MDGWLDEGDLSVTADLRFLAAWEEGRLPVLWAFFRARQIRRAIGTHGAADAPGMAGGSRAMT